MPKLPTGDDLRKRCELTGVDMQPVFFNQPQTIGGETRYVMSSRAPTDAELQQRLIDAERHIRESRTWMITVISGLASILSAMAAVIAVSLGKLPMV